MIVKNLQQTILYLKNEVKAKDENHRHNFKELVKESQKRIEHIEKNAKYLRRENEELKLENELLHDHVASKVSSRKAVFEQSDGSGNGIRRFDLQRKSLPEDLRRDVVPNLIQSSPISTDKGQFNFPDRPPTNFPERRSTSSYKDSSSEERNIKPSDIKEKNRASLTKRKSIDTTVRERRRSSATLRKQTDHKTLEIDHNPASDEKDELPVEVLIRPGYRGSLGRIPNNPNCRSPHDWIKQKHLPVGYDATSTDKGDDNADEKKQGVKSSWLSRNMSFLKSAPRDTSDPADELADVDGNLQSLSCPDVDSLADTETPNEVTSTVLDDDNTKTPLAKTNSSSSSGTRRSRRKGNYNKQAFQRRGSGKGRNQLGFRTGFKQSTN